MGSDLFKRFAHSAGPGNGVLRPPRGVLGARFAPGGRPGRSETASGRVLGRSWRLLGSSWGRLGALLAPPGAFLGLPGRSPEAPGEAPENMLGEICGQLPREPDFSQF